MMLANLMGRVLLAGVLLTGLPVAQAAAPAGTEAATSAPADAAHRAASFAAIATGDTDERVAALGRALAQPDAALARLIEALLSDGGARVSAGRVLLPAGGAFVDAVTGAPTVPSADAEDTVVNNRLRRELEAAQAGLKLVSPEVGVRREAAAAVLRDHDATRLPLLQRALAAERDDTVRRLLTQAVAAVQLADDDVLVRLAAARALGDTSKGLHPEAAGLLAARLADGAEAEPAVRQALAASLATVQSRLAWLERAGAVFAGLSLGSILLLAALGLAVTYGLMGVINMAHGELMMVGAYATWGVQQVFRAWAPQWFDAYLLVAVPAAFLVAAGVGALIERSVIRHLYGRPLETLLATFGISLMLMQTVRLLFGAQNVQVENPAWLSGGWVLSAGVALPWNRIGIMAFAALVLAGVALVLARTRLGLFVRGVTQNRRMAACVGVPTARVDMAAFALGSGIAGLAGCALSQVGNVGPDLGQGWIVDAFLVVVVGGVGQLAGAVVAGLGLGVAVKFMEGVAGAVPAKIALLVLVIAFIQKRPQGLFALRGRSAEA